MHTQKKKEFMDQTKNFRKIIIPIHNDLWENEQWKIQ